MTKDDEIARDAVDAIFTDIRDRRFLKWLFVDEPERAGPILHMRDGEPLMPLDTEVQDDIRAAWRKIITAAILSEREACAKVAEECAGDFERDTPGRTVGVTKRAIALSIRSRSKKGKYDE